MYTKTSEFSVTHMGRGGFILYKGMGGEIQIAIEMAEKGNFFVFLKGSKLIKPGSKPCYLKKAEQETLYMLLQAWLYKTQRSNWIVEK